MNFLIHIISDLQDFSWPNPFLPLSQLRLERHEVTKENAHLWERYFVNGFILSGLVWSVVVFFPYKEDLLASLLYILAVHVGINAAIAGIGISSAAQIGERLGIEVKENTDVTISSGLAEYKKGSGFDGLTQKEDSLLYETKGGGRNRMMIDRKNDVN